MKLLSEKVIQQVQKAFTELDRPVLIRAYVRGDGCETCAELLALVEELAAAHEKLSVDVAHIGPGLASDVLGAPAIRLLARMADGTWEDYDVVFYGTPSGYEFTSLVTSIVLVSKGDSGLARASREALAGLTDDVDLQVFVTPTCPYCPRAVILAHQMAIESPRVRAAMVEAMEFPEESMRHGISGVPHSVINRKAHVVGALSEPQFLAEVLGAIGARLPAA
jgi:glutaredoxin-like protein